MFPFDIFANGNTTRVSVSSAGMQGNGYSSEPSISSYGKYVAFQSVANNLVTGDSNGYEDIFVHERQTGQTSRVTLSSTGAEGNDRSSSPSISSDGRYVAFDSDADNLVAGDTNAEQDIYVHDLHTGQTERVSISSTGVQGDSRSSEPSISSDGRYVAFESRAKNLMPGESYTSLDVYVHDRVTNQIKKANVFSAGTPQVVASSLPSISSYGNHVAFEARAFTSVAGNYKWVSDIFVNELLTGQTTQVSISSTGLHGNDSSYLPSISSDGRFVAFESDANNLVVGDTNGLSDVFVHDRQMGQTERVSVSSAGVQGNGSSSEPSISSYGRYVAFQSDANNLVVGDTNGTSDIFVHDRQTGQTTRISMSSTGTQGNGSSYLPSISSDGRFVAFESDANNLVVGDTNGLSDVFVHDRFPELGENVPRYRLYNPNTYHHHYTTNAYEYHVLGTIGWIQEGTGCYLYDKIITINSEDTVPYYRLYNPNSFEHHWTTDANEYKVLGAIGWNQEGADGYVFLSQVSGSLPLYRLYNPNDGLHHWTMDSNERTVLIGYGWIDEGIACYVFP